MSPFLRTQLRPVNCWRLHYHPCPYLCRPSKAACDLDRGTCKVLLKFLLQPQCVNIPHLLITLSHVDGVVWSPELLLSPESCNNMSCDNTWRRPVLGGRLCRVWEFYNRLFHWHEGDPPPQGSLSYALEEGRHEHVPEGHLYWSKSAPYVLGDPILQQKKY